MSKKKIIPTIKPGYGAPDRPKAFVVDGLPRNAMFYGKHSLWENIALTLWNNTGKWVQLEKAYTQVGSAVHSARQVIAARYGEKVAEALRIAYATVQDRHIVYLMLDYYEEQPQPEVQIPDSERPPLEVYDEEEVLA